MSGHPGIARNSVFDRLQRAVLALWACALILAVYPVDDPATAPKLLVTGLLGALVAFLWLLDALFRKHAPTPFTPGMQFLLGFLLAHAVAMLFSSQYLSSAYALYPWIAFAVLGFAAGRLYAHEQQVDRLTAIIAGAITVSSLYGFAQQFGWDPFPWAEVEKTEYTASPSTYGNPNFAGHALIFGVVLSLGLALRKGRRWWLIPAAVMAGHLYLTQMRSAPLALCVAAVLVLLFAAVHRFLRRPLLSACIVFTLFAALGGTALYQVYQRVPEEGPLPLDSSLILRLNSLHTGARLALDHPFLGTGPGGYERESVAVWTPFQQLWFVLERQRGTHVHCDVVEAAVEAGAPGAFFYLALMLWPIVQALRLAGSDPSRRRLGFTFAALFTAFAVDGLFGFNLRVPVSAGLFFLCYGVLDGVQRRRDQAPARLSPAPALGAFVTASLCAAVAVCSFVASHASLYARGAQLYAQESLRQGDAAGAQSALEEARLALERSARLQPWERAHHERLGTLALAQHRATQALEHFEAAVALDPDAPDLHVRVAQARISRADAARQTGRTIQEELEDVRASLDRAEKHCSRFADAAEARARLALLEAAVATEPKESDAHRRSAAVHARHALEYGIRDRAGVYLMLAGIATEDNDAAAAQSWLARAGAAMPGRDETWNHFQRVAQDSGDLSLYLDALQRTLAEVLDADPFDSTTAVSLATRVGEVFPTVPGNPAGVPGAVAEVAQAAQDNLNLWGAVARCYSEENRLASLRDLLPPAEAGADPSPISVLLEGIAEGGKQPETCAYLKILLHDLPPETPSDTADRAFGWLAELLEVHLDTGLSDTERGRILSTVGEAYGTAARWEDAARVLDTATSLLAGGEKATAQLHLSRALAGQGKKAEALSCAQQAAAAATVGFEARWNLAQRLAEAGETAKAKFEYTMLLSSPTVPPDALPRIQAELDALNVQQRDSEP